MSDILWRIICDSVERGWLEFEGFVPGVECDCCDTWAGIRYIPVQTPLRYDEEPGPRTVDEVRAICKGLFDKGLRSPYATDDTTAFYFGFCPGDSFGSISWQEMPKPVEAFEPVLHSHGVFTVAASGASPFPTYPGAWFVPIASSVSRGREAFAFFLNRYLNDLSSLLDDLPQTVCSKCRRNSKQFTPDHRRRLGITRKSLARARALPRCLVPNDHDAFGIHHLDGYFLSERLFESLKEFFAESQRVNVEQWMVVPDIEAAD